ncbi:MAG: tRNA uridine-5-carboxymethylaminomethyl(34) synthesis GTPase MnmE, partial [Nitrospirae bacterium]
MAGGTETIVAVATPPGRGAVGVVRLSGPEAEGIAASCLRWNRGVPPPRTLARGRFLGPGGELLDEVLAVRFPGPGSYTGEDVVEIHAHGAPVVLEAMVRALVAAGARPARPGEFTERAFLNGKLDLTQAEAVQALVAARSEAAARLARRLLAGELGAEARRLQEALTAVEAEVEAAIDFPEEEIDAAGGEALAARLAPVAEAVDRLLAGHGAARHRLEGVRVVLVGAVNAGKSSLFNRLVEHERAIVTPEPGTTRDYLEQAVAWEGLEVRLVDTAGLREAVGAAERAGIARSRAEVEQADLLLHVVDATAPEAPPELPERPTLVVWNKIDLGPPPPPAGLGEVVAASARTGEGVGAVRGW